MIDPARERSLSAAPENAASGHDSEPVSGRSAARARAPRASAGGRRRTGRHAARSPAERLEESFERRIAAFVAAARGVRSASDPEAIHDVRVAIRRLSAALRLWRSLIPQATRRATLRRLRRLRRRLGRVRELEVHVELLQARLAASSTATRAAIAALVMRIKGRLARRRSAARRRVSPKRVRRTLRLLEAAAGPVRIRLVRDPAAVQDALAIERDAGQDAVRAVRAAAVQPEDLLLHAARIGAKKWRYAIECLEEVVPGGRRRDLRVLRRIQTALGDVHDRAVLRDVIADLSPGEAMKGDAVGGTGDEADPFRTLTDRLEAERLRAVRRFRRFAAILSQASATTGASKNSSEAPAVATLSEAPLPPPAALSPPKAARRVPPDRRPEPSREASEPRKDPREERWRRMADWLGKIEPQD